jgi:1-acyl-sn-glycerol-3-phosphate acyltransferase
VPAHEEDDEMLYWLLKTVLTPVLRVFYRVRVKGLEHVPEAGPAILASNHLSFSDSIFLPLVLRRRITFAAKAEYFENLRTAWIFRALGQIPIKRGGGDAAQRGLDSAKEILDDGGLFGIYPEGTRSRDGRLHRGRTGVARLAMECRVPVLAVGMIGTAELQPVGRTLPRVFKPVEVNISQPVSFDDDALSTSSSQAQREITDDIMLAVGRQSGQEYVG